jgi:hypothetical protein
MFPVSSPLAEGRDKRYGTLQVNRAERLGGAAKPQISLRRSRVLHQEGYASRNRETELAFPPERQGGNVRPPSRFSSDRGRVTDAKQQLGFCVFWLAENAVQNQDSPGARAAVGVSGFRVSRKEFWFAYF